MNPRLQQFLDSLFLSLLLFMLLQYFGPFRSAQEEAPQKNRMELLKERLSQPTPPVHVDQPSPGHVVLENDSLRVALSPQGGMVASVRLKGLHKAQGEALDLLTTQESQMGWQYTTAGGEGEEVLNTQHLLFTTSAPSYQVVEGEKEASVTWTYYVDQAQERYIQHTYRLGGKGHQLHLEITQQGVLPLPSAEPQSNAQSSQVTLGWYHQLKCLEKDIYLSRWKTTAHYYLARGKMCYLPENKSTLCHELAQEPVAWMAFKRRFFLQGLLAHNTTFTQAEFMIAPPPAQESTGVAKEAGVVLTVDAQQLAREPLAFSFYFGPNSAPLLRGLAPGFADNHYRGPFFTRPLNDYLLQPLSDFFSSYLPHYIWVLLLLLLLLKLFLLPLAYQNHLDKIRRKALAPFLSKLKGKYEGDPHKAELQTHLFYSQRGLHPLRGFLLPLLQVPLFIAMLNFVQYNLSLRQLSFLWVKDLAGYDDLISLPFSLPLLGQHISLFALAMSCSMYFLGQPQEAEPASSDQEQAMHIMRYAAPVLFFLVFNSFSAAWSLYQFCARLIDWGLQQLFHRLVDEQAIAQAVITQEQEGQKTATDSPPTTSRAHARLLKKWDKKNKK